MRGPQLRSETQLLVLLRPTQIKGCPSRCLSERRKVTLHLAQSSLGNLKDPAPTVSEKRAESKSRAAEQKATQRRVHDDAATRVMLFMIRNGCGSTKNYVILEEDHKMIG